MARGTKGKKGRKERCNVERSSRRMNDPPPPYEPGSGFCTLTIYYGGQLRPNLIDWVGGDVVKLDYAKTTAVNVHQLIIYCYKVLGLTLASVILGKKPGEEKFFLVRTNEDLDSLYCRDEIEVYILEGIEAQKLGLCEGFEEAVVDDGHSLADAEGDLREEEHRGEKQRAEEHKGEEDLREEEQREVQSEDEELHFRRERNRKGKNVVLRDEEEDEHYSSGSIDLFDSDYDLEDDSGDEDDFLYTRNVDDGVEWVGNTEKENRSEKDLGDGVQADVGSGDEDLLLSEDDFPTYDDDDDDDDDGEGVQEQRPQVYNQQNEFRPNFHLGMIFGTKKEFKDLVTSHCIQEGRSVYFTKSDKTRIYARCADKECIFRMNVRRKKEDVSFELTALYPDHNCVRDYHVRNMNSTWLSRRFGYDWKNDKNKNVEGWRKSKITENRCHITWWMAYNAKRKSLRSGVGNNCNQYSMLRSFANEVLRSNPGSTVLIGTEPVGTANQFSRFYMCLAALKEGFLKACRPLFGVDGTFLKGPYGGILLTAVGIDPNNNLYPFAWAVVNKEDGANWEWFLTILKEDLRIVRDDDWTIISDKQKGLVKAVQEVFPFSAHRFCVSHMHSNFMTAGFRGQAFKIALWKAAKATTVGEFTKRMEEIRLMEKKAFDWLKDKHPEQWSRSHFGTGPKCDILLNNLCESFNAKILRSRELPILDMLESIMEKMMERMREGRDRGNNWKGPFCPKIRKIIEENKSKVADCQPVKSSDRFYQVSCIDGNQYAVDLEMFTCGCRKWELSGIPCKHALSALACQKVPLERYVHPCYRVETYKDAYGPCILPMNGRNEWAPTVPEKLLPPKLVSQAGRPPKARRREPDELPVRRRRAGRPTTLDGHRKKRNQDSLACSRCGGLGHNKRSCVRRDADAERELLERQDEAVLDEANEGIDLYGERTQGPAVDGVGSHDGDNVADQSDDLNISDEYMAEIDEIIREHSQSTTQPEPTITQSQSFFQEREEASGWNVKSCSQPTITQSQSLFHEKEQASGWNVMPQSCSQPNFKQAGKERFTFRDSVTTSQPHTQPTARVRRNSACVNLRVPPRFVGNQPLPHLFKGPRKRDGPIVKRGASKYLVLSGDEVGNAGKGKSKK